MAFFGLVLAGGAVAPALSNIGMTPLYAAVLVGAAQNVFSKSAKYSLFDPCKEMAYIPLDRETQARGSCATQPCTLGRQLGACMGLWGMPLACLPLHA